MAGKGVGCLGKKGWWKGKAGYFEDGTNVELEQITTLLYLFAEAYMGWEEEGGPHKPELCNHHVQLGDARPRPHPLPQQGGGPVLD